MDVLSLNHTRIVFRCGAGGVVVQGAACDTGKNMIDIPRCSINHSLLELLAAERRDTMQIYISYFYDAGERNERFSRRVGV